MLMMSLPTVTWPAIPARRACLKCTKTPWGATPDGSALADGVLRESVSSCSTLQPPRKLAVAYPPSFSHFVGISVTWLGAGGLQLFDRLTVGCEPCLQRAVEYGQE